MDLQNVLGTLKEQLGSKFDKAKVEEALKKVDLSKGGDILDDIKSQHKELDGGGKAEGIVDEIKGAVGGLFGKK